MKTAFTRHRSGSRWKLLASISLVLAWLQPAARAEEKLIFSSTYVDSADFEAFATTAKQSGATHLDIAQSLPWSYWEYDRPDEPDRSWFAPSIDHPEVLALYREAVAILLRRCPEIDQIDLTTKDFGAGLDRSQGLYSGSFGNTRFRERDMAERLQLDGVHALGLEVESSPVLRIKSGCDRQLLTETAREESDNTAELIELLGSSAGEYLLLAAKPEEEDSRLPGPDIVQHLRPKLAAMNARWEHYARMFTTPNW